MGGSKQARKLQYTDGEKKLVEILQNPEKNLAAEIELLYEMGDLAALKPLSSETCLPLEGEIARN